MCSMLSFCAILIQCVVKCTKNSIILLVSRFQNDVILVTFNNNPLNEMDEKTKRNKTKVIKLNKQNRSYRFELNFGLK